MKGLKKIAGLFIALLLAVVITACSSTGGIETSLNVASRNNKLTLVANFTDESQRIFTDYTPYAYIYNMDGNNVADQIESLSFTLDEDLSSGSNFVTDELVFDDLSENTRYTIRITVTIDGRSYTLYDEIHQTSDLGTESNPIEVSTTDEFLAIADDREAYYILTADLDFKNEAIDPFFTSSTRRFEGGLDGDNHTISNFTITSNNQYNGLFAVNNGTICNLVISNATITTERSSEMNTGLLVGYNTGVIDNVTLNDCIINSSSTAYTVTYDQNVGGLVGLCGTSNDTAITNSTLNNVTINANVRHQSNVGGLVGEVVLAQSVRNTQTIENNLVNVTMTVNQEIRGSIADAVDINVGGFAGFSAAASTNCFVNGTITVNTKKADAATYENGLTHYNLTVAGFIGNTYNNVARRLEDVGFAGSITVDASPVYETHIAGLIGVLGNNFLVNNAVVSLDALNIKGPEEVADSTAAKEDTAEGPAYNMYYGILIASVTDSNILTTNNIISYKEVTPTVTSGYLTVAPNNLSSDLTKFSDFIKNQFNN